MTHAEMQSQIDAIYRSIEASFGKGSIMLPDSEIQAQPVIPTGIVTIDRATGVGGIPKGRITEIYGVESSGKSTLALHTIAEAQQLGLSCAYIDAENAFDPGYAQQLGVRVEDLLLSQPDSGEQALELIEALVKLDIGCIVLDSVAALVPSAELEGSMEQQFVGLQARLISKGLRKITGVTGKHGCALIFLNQIREKIGGYGNPETTPGGRALKFYASLRIEMRKGETILHGTEAEGQRIKVKVVKNKLAPPHRHTEASIYFGKGFSRRESLLDAAIAEGVVSKSGAWLSRGESRWHGRNGLLSDLQNNEALENELTAALSA